VCLLAVALPATTAVLAYPEGAPWGSARPAAAESCGACHYDYEPIEDSADLTIAGLPDAAVAGESYELTIRLLARDARISGFQILAEAGGEPAGSFGAERDDIEAIGAASRSVRPLPNADGFVWSLRWRAPDAAGRIDFFVAASSANDDQSPFGDTIHFRHYTVAVRPREEY
jgi:hypothetical protein